MALRAYWTGSIRLSLVSVPARLFAATQGGRAISLHLLDRRTGERIRYTKTAGEAAQPGETGEAIDKDDIVKGFEYARGQYVQLEPEELDRLKIESKHTVAVAQFVDADEIDPIYFEKPYFVVPDGTQAQEPFVLFREALKRSRKVALGQITSAERNHVAAVRPCGRGMILETLRFADEVRTAKEIFGDIPDLPVDEADLDLAERLIAAKVAPFDIGRFEDQYQAALQALIDAKLADRPVAKDEPEPRRPGKVVDLMAALKRSLEQDGAGANPAPAPRPAGRGEAAAATPEPAPPPPATKAARRKRA